MEREGRNESKGDGESRKQQEERHLWSNVSTEGADEVLHGGLVLEAEEPRAEVLEDELNDHLKEGMRRSERTAASCLSFPLLKKITNISN